MQTSTNYPRIFIKKEKVAPIRRFHPWIFSGAIQRKEGTFKEGSVVEVVDNKGRFLAIGHYQDASIAVRILSFEEVSIDGDFWLASLSKAYNLRSTLGLTNNENTNAYRLVHGEGDGLSGLIIDYYNGTLVIQCHTVGMYKNLKPITAALQTLYGEQLRAIYNKSKAVLPQKFGLSVQDGYLFGEGAEVEIRENTHTFSVNWEVGQKTGFFLDQRRNRDLLAQYSKGKTVLNTFCYTGGFSIYALQAGATLVHSVDASKKAIQWTDKNVILNGFDETKHQSFVSDTFKFFKQNDKQYDVMVVDPPAYAKNRKAKHNAVQGYKRLNEAALRSIKKGGIIFTFSCSQVIGRELFEKTILSAAINVGRSVQILHRLSQPDDHPVNIFHAESSYLKGLVLFVR